MKITMTKIEVEIKERAKQKAKALGMTLQGYIKSLIVKDAADEK